MPDEITLKDLWNKQETMRTEMLTEIKELRQHFMTFEAGRVSALEKNVAQLLAAKEALEKKDAGYDKDAEKRKDWMWGAFEKIMFAVIGAVFILLGSILSKLNILNL